jgi:hypothetical protein
LLEGDVVVFETILQALDAVGLVVSVFVSVEFHPDVESFVDELLVVIGE